MALSSKTIIDKVEVLEDGSIQVRQAEIISKDGAEITRSFNRWVRHPGDILAQSDPSPVPAIATAVWTPDVISAYQESLPKY
tara:strand:- start:233 stop:478 length:246 start_codon:yes stop_codon:yes gene_type:complete